MSELSADNDDKLRESSQDILFINEANRINREAFLQLSMRTRKFISLDFNPSERFWAHEDLKENTPINKDNESV